jgi:polyisoprenoid-binding protein YceI
MGGDHIMLRTAVFPIMLVLATPAMAAESYTLDPSHTYPRWAASHFGFSTHHGQFNKTSGKLVLDPKSGKGSVEVTVDAASVSTGDLKFDEHLKSADFFDVKQHPAITFKSKSMKFENGRPVSASGDFTMLGVTRPMTFRISGVKCGMHPIAKKEACGAEVSGTVKRSAHGMKYGIPGISDDIRLAIQVEAIKE